VRFEPLTNEVDLNDPEGAFLNKAISLVEQNLQDESFGIQSMIDELFMSQSTLYRKIKSLTGLSITVFIRSIRLKKSAEIILTEDHKLSFVAAAVGFNDNKYFRESFKKQFGCLPSKYKQTFANKTK
jgi:AraC-like DNA-binding protein